MATLGIAAGLMVTPLTTGVLNSVDTEESGLASGINHAVSRTGNLLAIALAGVLLALRYKYHLKESMRTMVDEDEQLALAEVLTDGATDTLAQADLSQLPAHLKPIARAALTHALDKAFVEVMLAASLCCCMAAFCAFRLSDNRIGSHR